MGIHRFSTVTCSCTLAFFLSPIVGSAQPLPFESTIETYRSEDGDVTAFGVRLEQPFLAEQFEKSNLLRLEPLDDKAYLVYPKETKFSRKYAEFFGRLKGTGTARLKLSYEVVTEDLAGAPKVDVKTTEIEVPIPEEMVGIEDVYKQWAQHQNAHFAELLQYYPETSFFEFVLLQSQDRYGVQPPPIPSSASQQESNSEYGLYHTFSGGLALQQSLQREVLGGKRRVGDLSTHISRLSAPRLDHLNYDELLKAKQAEGVNPRPHELTRMVPEDQFFLHFASIEAVNELMDLSSSWGASLLRMLTVSARDHHLQQKYEDQLCLQRHPLSQLFADEVVAELAITGSDFFFAEGTDVTVLLRLKNVDVFRQAAETWLANVKEKYPDLQERDVNYRGHQIAARYTQDRTVSSFVLYKDETAIFSNSPVVMRKIIDTILEESPGLHAATDYRYVTTLLPPVDDLSSGYLYLSEAFLTRLISAPFKIAQKRRLQAFNNLVMLNNASMFYRLEYGDSPQSLSDLVKGRFYDPREVVDPMGGAFAWDAAHDTATSSIFNRLKYLTPIVELDVMQVSAAEQQEYERYKQRYESFWKGYFDPIAVRIQVGRPTVRLETLVLPFANGSLYRDLQSALDEQPQPLGTARIARSAILSLQLVPGRNLMGRVISTIPGVQEVLEEDPTLTDMSWIGDRISLHYLDDNSILEVDPTRFQRTDELFGVGVPEQTALSAVLAATSLPVYLTVDVEDEDKAARLLEQLSSRIVLKGQELFGLPTQFDAYRLPDYQQHKIYVLSYQLYALKIRLHASLVSGRLVAATKLDALREAIDAAAEANNEDAVELHALLRVNFRAMNRINDDLQMYWNEKLRQAAHRNIMPFYTLITLYDVPIDQVNVLADAKYGVTYFCPGGGEYQYDAASDQVDSTVYGNRQHARQPLAVNEETAFSKFINGVDEITAGLRFLDDGLISTVEIVRGKTTD